MKTMILGLAAILSSCLAFAQPNTLQQTNNGVPSFLDVKIEGNVDEFLQKIEAKGFSPVNNESGNVFALKGMFGGENADLLILSTEKSKQVYAVVVLIKSGNNWKAVKSDFKTLKNKLIEQYGKPDENSHSFALLYDDVQDRMQKVKLGLCDYSCTWVNPKVSMEITKNARIMITYDNGANVQLYAAL